jgi:hypothetical protein
MPIISSQFTASFNLPVLSSILFIGLIEKVNALLIMIDLFNLLVCNILKTQTGPLTLQMNPLRIYELSVESTNINYKNYGTQGRKVLQGHDLQNQEVCGPYPESDGARIAHRVHGHGEGGRQVGRCFLRHNFENDP